VLLTEVVTGVQALLQRADLLRTAVMAEAEAEAEVERQVQEEPAALALKVLAVVSGSLLC
jgi:hypothetical protein